MTVRHEMEEIEENFDIYYEDISTEIKEERVNKSITDLLNCDSSEIENRHQEQIKKEGEVYYENVENCGSNCNILIDSLICNCPACNPVQNSCVTEDGNPPIFDLTTDSKSLLFLRKQYKETIEKEKTLPALPNDDNPLENGQFNKKETRHSAEVNEPVNLVLFPEFSGNIIKAKSLCKSKKQFICEKCSRSFVREHNLRNHLCRNPANMCCKFCKKSFTQNVSLNRHERSHTVPRKLSKTCKICSKNFECRYALERHMRSHSGEKPFKCKICTKSFSQAYNLQRHERKHSGEKPYQCRFCLKYFAENFSKIIHERIHTGEKPFSCKFCGKPFSEKALMKRHEVIHSGVKSFHCKICTKSFFYKSSLGAHREGHARKIKNS